MRRANLAVAATAVVGIGAAAVVMIFHHGSRHPAADEAAVAWAEDPGPSPSVDDLTDPGETRPAVGETGDAAFPAVADVRPLVLQGDISNKSHMPLAVILTNLPDPDALANRYDDWGVQESLIAYGQCFHDKNGATWKRELIDPWLEANVPRDYDGYLTLDWEVGEAFESLLRGPADPGFSTAVQQFVSLLRHIRSLRPKAKLGYYALPVGGNTNDPQWQERMRALQPIYDASDALFPSFYFRSKVSLKTAALGASVLLPLALELAQGKPVFAYTWHRYLPSTPGGYRLVPEEDYIRHIRHLLNIESDGKRVTGIVAWGADKSQFENSQWITRDGTFGNKGLLWDNVRATFAAEMRPGEDIDDYLSRLYARVYSLLAKAAEQVPEQQH